MHPVRLLLIVPVLLSAVGLVSLRAALDAPVEVEFTQTYEITAVSVLH